MIIRVEHKKRYTVIANRTIQDGRLSYRARGLLIYVLSFPDGSQLDATRLASATQEGRDAVRTALAELEAHGYLKRSKVRGPNGTIVTRCVVYEVPTGDGFPGAGKPGAGFPGPVVTTSTELQVLPGVADEPPLTASESKRRLQAAKNALPGRATA